MNRFQRVSISLVTMLCIMMAAAEARGHCDALDGPVVRAAQKALDTRNVNFALIWVRKQDETEIGNAFERTLRFRKISPDAREFADKYFFETLVRLHRAAEGAPFTGLKPAGLDIGPAIPTADKALETGSVDTLLKLLTESMRKGIIEHFERTNGLKRFGSDEVEGGRKYVEAYVAYVHYVEKLYEASMLNPEGHFTEKSSIFENAAPMVETAWWVRSTQSSIFVPCLSLNANANDQQCAFEGESERFRILRQ